MMPIVRNSANCSEDDEPADDQRELTVALIAARQQPLHEQLIGAVRRHRQKASRRSTPAQNVNGTVRSHDHETTCSLPARAASAAIDRQPPGTR